MNERLKELYQQSWRSQFVSGVRTGEDITLTEFDYEKFAELLVKECIDCAVWVGNNNHNPVEPIHTAHAVKRRIEKQFGVEE